MDWTIMTPTLKLGPEDSPSIEFMPRDVEPLVILMIECGGPMCASELDSVWTFAQIDTLYLHEDSVGFFRKLEEVCRRVLAGELKQYSVIKIKNSEFAGYLDRDWNTGEVTAGVKEAAHRYLEFLAGNPEHWPPKFSKDGVA